MEMNNFISKTFNRRFFVGYIIMMPDTEVQCKLSESYLQAVCSFSGYVIYKNNYDTGMDFHIKKLKLTNGKPREVPLGIDIQLKSTTNFKIEDDVIKYQLENKNYNQLVETNVGIKRILVLFLMPEGKENWLNQTTDFLTLKKCAYWCTLQGKMKTQNEDSKTTIAIPLKNIFSEESLNEMFNDFYGGEI